VVWKSKKETKLHNLALATREDPAARVGKGGAQEKSLHRIEVSLYRADKSDNKMKDKALT